MAVLNLRGVDNELAAQLKSEAALAGISLREYCIGILSCAMVVADKKWPWNGYGVSGAELGVSKKIAGDVGGGGAEGGGGTPSLPRGGKAQVLGYGALNAEITDKVLAENGLHLPTSGFGGGNILYGRPTSETPPGTEVAFPLKPRSEGLSRLAAKKIAEGSVLDYSKIAGDVGMAMKADMIAALGSLEVSGSLTASTPGFYAEKYTAKNKLESVDGVEGRRAAGEAGGIAGRNSETVPENDNGVEGVAVGVGKPKVNMAALRDICAGNIPPATIIVDSRVLTEVVGGYIDLGTMPVCVACDGPLEESRGKLACPDESCGKYGQVQKGKCKRGERVDG